MWTARGHGSRTARWPAARCAGSSRTTPTNSSDAAGAARAPAALGRVRIQGPADVLLGYLPDLEQDIRTILLAAGHGAAAVAALGEGLTDPLT
jgi:hypothetical protein